MSDWDVAELAREARHRAQGSLDLAVAGLAELLADLLYQLARLGVAAEAIFREHELAVDADLEDAALRRDERDLLDAFLELDQQIFRRTDGLGCVLSLDAVFDADAGASFGHWVLR